MATLINAEGVCPSGGACGGGAPAVAARASNHIHTHVPPPLRSPASSRVQVCLLPYGAFLCGSSVAHDDMEMWASASMTDDATALRQGVSCRLFHTLVDSPYRGVQVVLSTSFCIKSNWGCPHCAAASAEARRSQPINRFYFPLSTLSCSHKSQSAALHRRTVVFALLVSTEFVNKGGSLPKQYFAIWASKSFISNCHKCVGPRWHLAKDTRRGKHMTMYN